MAPFARDVDQQRLRVSSPSERSGSSRRLFVAINLPQDVRQGVWDAAAGLREGSAPIKWVRVECIHLTLKFLGNVLQDREAAVTEAVEAAVAGTKPFPLVISGFGVFPQRGAPRVVWVGCEPSPALEILQHRIEQRLEPVGFPLELRTFSPHLTLGRAKRGARPSDFGDLRTLIHELDHSAESFVEHVDLMESTLGRDGPRYTVRHAASFAQ